MTDVALGPPRLGKAETQALVEIARRLSGVSVDASKRDFVALRVGRRLRALECADFADYLDVLEGPDGAAEARLLVEALTTHTTSFFREKAHYDWLAAEGLPTLIAAGAGREQPLTVWSAACSLGSELWSAGMVLARIAAARPGLRWALVGTDVSRAILRRAATAVFTEEEIAGLSEAQRREWLLRARAGAFPRPLFRIAPALRARARLAWANLVDLDPALSLEADVAFLRNVLIYFEPADQRRAIANVTARLRRGGYLLTGHSESLAELPAGLTQLAASIYRKD